MAQPVVHFEIIGKEPAKLRSYFGELFGWEAWRDLAGRYGLGLVQFGLRAAMEAGAIVPLPVAPLAHVLIGALNESALYVARAEDGPAAREQCVAILDRILRGLRTGG